MVEASVEPDAASSAPCQEHMARGERRETVESTQRSLLELRLLITSDITLDCPTDDTFLLKFLRAAKHRVPEAFERIQRYFNARQRWPELFDDLSPSTVNYGTVVSQNRLVMVSNQRDHEGRTIALIKVGSWNTGICPLTDFMRACILLVEWSLLNEEAQLRGVVCVFDLKGLQVSHMAHYTPSVVKMAAHICQDCIPARLKAIYVINHPYLFNLLFAAVKPFLKLKLVKRIHFMGHDLQKIHDILPPDVIPNELGGTLENFDCARQEEDLGSATGFFESMCRSGYKTQ